MPKSNTEITPTATFRSLQKINIIAANKSTSLIVLVILIVGGFYLTTIRKGHNWGGDFSMYIHHAKNIVEGIDYKDTGYIQNPYLYLLGPKTYPPIFPLLLSPVYKLFGLNLTAMKIEIILIFLLFLFMFFLVFRNEIPFQYLVTIIAVIGFNPFFWNFKDNILSDIPFMLFIYTSFFFINQAYKSSKLHRPNLVYGTLVGFFICLSYGTRTIGAVLVPCLFLSDIIKFKRPTKVTIIATLIFFLYVVAHKFFSYSDNVYYSIFAKTKFKIFFYNLKMYIRYLIYLWTEGYSWEVQYVLSISTCVLAIIGYISRIKDEINFIEIFFLLYLVIIIIYPYSTQGMRFLFPVIPLYIFYIFLGIRKIFLQRKRMETLAFILMTVAIIISYARGYATMNFNLIDEGIGKKETIELFDFIKKRTDKKDVFIFEKPRVLSLFTGRKASCYHSPRDNKDLYDYFQEINASYVVAGRVFNRDPILRSVLKRYKDNFIKVYSNSDFDVYKIRDVSS
jgi:hypothetical protein